MSQIRLIAIRDTPLSIDEVRQSIADPAAGGEALFIGTVRDNYADKAGLLLAGASVALIAVAGSG